MKGTVLLVEDEDDTREMLGRAITRADYSCITAANATQGLALAMQAPKLDAVVADVVLGSDERGGLRLLTDLRAAGIAAPVIIITAYADVEKVKFALNEGAAHLLEKTFRAGDLIAAIERVTAPSESPPDEVDRVLTRAKLTQKERTVARHLLEGLSSSEIAELENNSPKTIRQHVSQIYAKCGVSSRAEFFRLLYAK